MVNKENLIFVVLLFPNELRIKWQLTSDLLKFGKKFQFSHNLGAHCSHSICQKFGTMLYVNALIYIVVQQIAMAHILRIF
jgi:hypothetical protein